MIAKTELLLAFKNSIGVMMGYLSLGFAFALLTISYNYPWYIAIIMSIFIYAGALQFAAIGFFNAKLGLLDIAIASFFINIRQSFYGLSLLKKFAYTKAFKKYLTFALTDETYALLTSIEIPKNIDNKLYYFYLSIFNQLYWITGTAIGVVVGSSVEFNSKGVEFSLSALFIVLAIEQYKSQRSIKPFIIGVVASVLSMSLLSNNMLLGAIVISLILLFLLNKQLGAHGG
jgi:4-azaleucine resistance transporter AzlC